MLFSFKGASKISPRLRLQCLTTLAMLAFAGNSLLCRAALKQTTIDPASFTSIRLVAGALVLAGLLRLRQQTTEVGSGLGNWPSAFALFAYAACFSYAYVSLPTAMGALLLFGSVQATMISYGVWAGERLNGLQAAGLLAALGGVVGLFLPGLTAPPLFGAALMVAAGVAWGVYSLRGKIGNPLQMTAGNFLRTVPLALGLSVITATDATGATLGSMGVGYAIASGALTSGIGYAIWYAALPALRATSAATVQLSVPVIAAIGGVLFLGESLTLRLVLASLVILGGVAVVVSERAKRR